MSRHDRPRAGDGGDRRDDDYSPEGLSTDEIGAFVEAHCAQIEAERAAREVKTSGGAL